MTPSRVIILDWNWVRNKFWSDAYGSHYSQSQTWRRNPRIQISSCQALSRTGNTKLVLFKSSQNFRHWAVIQYDLQCLKDKQTSWLTLILQDFCTYQGTESTYHKTKQRLQKKTKKKVCNVSKFNHTTIMQAVSIFSSRGFLRVFRTLAVLQPYTVPSVKPLKL